MRARLALPGLLAVGCLTYQPLPAPSARIDAIGPCVGCITRAAVVVSLSGDDALPGAHVAVYDTRVMYALGQRPAAIAKADAQGRWRVSLRALTAPGHEELPVLEGDVLGVIQKRAPEGEASAPYHIEVPRVARDDRPEPLIAGPEEPGPTGGY